ncbi:putative Zn(2)-C6 fungal-type domain-containing protein [Seiridium cardinale]|uniref:Zn(2)-C6 fungal-type domain-containing protein n=1 Tax=Seiridium cardinale TaxID=138064 RepID=A0ABR2XBR2_9PEZI
MAEVHAPLMARSMQDAGPSATRKKFATPPVKIACLACRASRTRCTGENPCASCKSKDRPCLYKPSRRGGPRIRKRPRPPEEKPEPVSSEPEQVSSIPSSLLVENYINPGAGLKNINEVVNDSDTLFDNLFGNATDFATTSSQLSNEVGPMARSYDNDIAVLNAYYIWIHPYFPILPPPSVPLLPDDAKPLFEARPMDIDESSSPVALAISAILALIPCAQDSNPLAGESVLFRRKYAQFLAQSAFECIETESEKPESSVEPSRALDDSDDEFNRQPFHPAVPLEIESTIALSLLSVYEYAQRGNLKRMRTRANAALMSALSMSLHAHRNDEDAFSEARRRAWWMTYICVCQSSIVSNTKPAFDIFTHTFTSPLPVIQADPEAWPLFIQSQQAILTATQFVIDLNEAMNSHADMNIVYRKMVELELFLEPLVTASENWAFSCSPNQLVDQYEVSVAQALRSMSRIKLNSARIKVHRYCAFFDLPVFPRKNCDLKAVLEKGKDDTQELRHWPSCCNSLINGNIGHPSHSATSSSPTLSMRSSPSDGGQSHQTPLTPVFPYSSHQSAKICLKSALSIAQAFDLLPYPNPTNQLSEGPSYLGPFSNILSPRTMPSFACCAMQCAYVLLMVHDKTQTMYSNWNGDTGSLANNLLGRLQQGILSILGTLENYGTAFEALGGMRDQIRDKVYSTVTFDS